jgi:hypothetical protein
MWRNIGKYCLNTDMMAVDHKVKTQRISVDCSNSSRGLFMGIFVLVASVITMITFSVLVKSTYYIEAAPPKGTKINVSSRSIFWS